MCDCEGCEQAHDAILGELQGHTHPQLDQLADHVLGPVIFGGTRDQAQSLKAGQESLRAELRVTCADVSEVKASLSNGGFKVKLPWSFYGTLATAMATILAAYLTTH